MIEVLNNLLYNQVSLKSEVKKMAYKYQMHAHTLPCSDCAQRTIEELVEHLHLGGYQGCVITNHFLNGNTGIDRKLPWNEFVRQYELDYLRGKEAAEKYDIDLIFGVEEHVSGGLEILCYGITPDILYAHPELSERSCKVWHDVLSSYGALCIQAHPFRARDYIREPKLLPLEYIDGIEIFNAENNESENTKAEKAALAHPELILTSGADSHRNRSICIGGIESETRIRDEKELVSVLKSGKYEILK